MASSLTDELTMLSEVISEMYNNGEEREIQLGEFIKQKGWDFKSQIAIAPPAKRH